MAKVVITIEDKPDGEQASVAYAFDPPLPQAQTQEEIEKLKETFQPTGAQMIGLAVSHFLSQEFTVENEGCESGEECCGGECGNAPASPDTGAAPSEG